jgi:hypothetical protein
MSEWKHEPLKVNFPPFLGELRPNVIIRNMTSQSVCYIVFSLWNEHFCYFHCKNNKYWRYQFYSRDELQYFAVENVIKTLI